MVFVLGICCCGGGGHISDVSGVGIDVPDVPVLSFAGMFGNGGF